MGNSSSELIEDRMQGCLLGLACGDAVGTTVEFRPRGTFPDVTDMVGGGPFQLEPGQWTDDTSMALCLATSLIECSGFDPVDQIRRYVRWYREGYLSSTGECFDIGNTTASALCRFMDDGNPFAGPTSPTSAGNGSIMRLAPVPMFFFPDKAKIVHFSGESSRTTHGAAECVEACRLFGLLLANALEGKDKEAVLYGHGFEPGSNTTPTIRQIAEGQYRDKSRDELSGSGYVVESLEAALWCFLATDNFRDAVLAAVNLGDDADTTAAVCGQVAGAFYGRSGIPAEWLDRLCMREEIEQLAERLYRPAAGAVG